MQLKAGNYYATYMHLQKDSYQDALLEAFEYDSPLSENEHIANVGNTGTTGYHLHFSFAKSVQMWVEDEETSNPNILDWNATQINDFLDPLAYFN